MTAATLPAMMDSRLRWILILLAVAPLLTGCAVYQPVEIAPAKNTPPVAPRFTQSYYYYDRDQNLYFVMKSHTIDPVAGKPVDQIATIRVFWRPRGGVTTLDSTALNATFRYIVMTPDSVGMYEGAGFVRLLSKTGAGKFNARIMRADLRLSESSKSFVDTLGRARISGYFSAIFDETVALDALLGAQREFFARSLEMKPATQPASQPAATNEGAAGEPPSIGPPPPVTTRP